MERCGRWIFLLRVRYLKMQTKLRLQKLRTKAPKYETKPKNISLIDMQLEGHTHVVFSIGLQ